MKTSEFKLPLEASREVAMAIIDQLPREEFTKVVEDIRIRSRERALSSFRKIGPAVRKSELQKTDFDETIDDVRKEKNKKTTHRRS